MDAKILLIDDDPDLSKLMKLALTRHGFAVEVAFDGQEGVKQVFQTAPDLILLDIMMPTLDGWEACQRIRQMTDVPIIVMSAIQQDDAAITSLNCGADGFVQKPVTVQMALARIQAMLRRKAPGDESGGRYPIVTVDHVVIDMHKYEVKVGEQRVKLSPLEYKLLTTLAQHKGQVLSHHYLLETVWGEEKIGEIDHLRLYINYLRKKLERDPANPTLIQTEWNIGYRLG